MTTVLIVDDHPSFRATARVMLESERFDVVGEVADGEAAVEAARALDPDVVLLDVQLPDTDGFSLAGRLACHGSTPTVVLTSSRDAADYGPLISRCGACAFIPKAELSGEALTAAIRSSP